MSEDRIFVRGEIDMATAPNLAMVLADATVCGRSDLVLDCNDLTFIDSSGVRVMLDAHQMLAKQGRHLTLVNVRPAQQDLFGVLGLTELLRIKPTARI